MDVRTQDMEMNMGPQHPSTHGVLRLLLRVDGEIVTGAVPYIGYIHRCAEKIGESVEWIQYLPYTDRYDYLAAMNNNLGYSMAVEKLLGIEIPERAMYIRTICAELNRIGSHLIAFGTYGLDLGAFTPFFYSFREREWILSLFEKICGARLTYSYIRIGGVFNDSPPGWLEEVAAFCNDFEEKWKEYNDLLSENSIFVSRTANVGVISVEDALAFGLTGPCLRGSGIAYDLRKAQPYELYNKFEFDIPVGSGRKGTVGDCWDRYDVRMQEMRESVKIVRQCLAGIQEGPTLAKLSAALRVPAGHAYVGIENPRGELGHFVISGGDKKAIRLRVRGPSFCNLSILPKALPGTMLADAVAVIGSIDIVLGEVDR
ncbi:MAG: NADH-quinone oxidoreductase subunit D [Planctomycetes bacterium]|nr:NADH-quinone oxidoreductase subunit D [Planctomycetota bacterium]